MAQPFCCNPFNIAGHSWSSRKKNLRPVREWMCEKAPHITIGLKSCDTCRKKLSDLNTPLSTPLLDDPDYQSPEETDFSDVEYKPAEAQKTVDEFLVSIGETPYSKSKARGKAYPKEKLKAITEAMQRTVLKDEVMDDGREMIQQLKKKFKVTADKRVQLQILTVLPQSWTIRKTQEEFGVSSYMARKAKELVKEKGVLSLPGHKVGHPLAAETVELVSVFYQSDDISRVMPGKKDFVSVKQEGKRVHIQKRLVLCNLREVYQAFKTKHPDVKVGFSKFAQLRPKQCILAGASGTHSVCVCTIHQNITLMLVELHMPDLPTYHICLARIMCNPPSPHCYYGECEACPGIEKLKEDLIAILDKNDVDQIVYKQWVSTDRSTLETCWASADEFVDTFCEKLELLRPHSFVASEQAAYYEQCKADLKPGDFLVTVDFSENYSFVIQDASQGFHWNNSQATIHPFVAHYRDTQEVLHISYVIISDIILQQCTSIKDAS